MSTKLEVELTATAANTVNEECVIETEAEIFHILITASIQG
jgi:hypothetical protein